MDHMEDHVMVTQIHDCIQQCAVIGPNKRLVEGAGSLLLRQL